MITCEFSLYSLYHLRIQFCHTLQHTATHCSTLQHSATLCNSLQHSATLCNTVSPAHSVVPIQIHGSNNAHNTVAAFWKARRVYVSCQCGAVWCSVSQCVAVCCRVLPCVAACCSVLQCVARMCAWGCVRVVRGRCVAGAKVRIVGSRKKCPQNEKKNARTQKNRKHTCMLRAPTLAGMCARGVCGCLSGEKRRDISPLLQKRVGRRGETWTSAHTYIYICVFGQKKEERCFFWRRGEMCCPTTHIYTQNIYVLYLCVAVV